MASKKTSKLIPIGGLLGAIGIYSKFSKTGCFRLSHKVPEVCGSDVYWYYVVAMTFCLALPLGYIYETYFREKSIEEYLAESNEETVGDKLPPDEPS